jgi:hypothetical protein
MTCAACGAALELKRLPDGHAHLVDAGTNRDHMERHAPADNVPAVPRRRLQ